jgi:L-threonylcarbamoyladenylate synthase
MALGEDDAQRLERCLADGGVAVFPTDTVYGVGCDPDCSAAVERLYRLKGRPASRPAAVMFLALRAALAAVGELGRAERDAVAALLPGPVTLLLRNPRHRFPLACTADPGTLGLRVPKLSHPLAALAQVRCPLLQSSANLSGERDARRLAEVPRSLLDGADLVLDGGELAGVASTVVDLREYRRGGAWSVVREGALRAAAVERALGVLAS